MRQNQTGMSKVMQQLSHCLPSFIRILIWEEPMYKVVQTVGRIHPLIVA